MKVHSRLWLSILVLGVALTVSGCLGPKYTNTPDPSSIAGYVKLGNSNFPVYGAPVTVNGKVVSTTSQYGLWIAWPVEPNVPLHYCVHTLFGDMCGDAIAPVGQQVRVEELRVPLPEEFDFYVFEEITGLVYTAVTRWPNGTTLRYFLDGGTEEQHTLVAGAFDAWLAGTPIEATNLLRVERVFDREEANMVISWGETRKPVFDVIKYDVDIMTQETLHVEIRIDEAYAGHTLPYHFGIGHMLGLGSVIRDAESVMSMFVSDDDWDKVVTEQDRLYLLGLYSLAPKYRLE